MPEKLSSRDFRPTSSVGPIFIVGNSRSGTTLIARMLSQHRDIYILGETHYFQSDVEKYFQSDSNGEVSELLKWMEAVQSNGIYRSNSKPTSSSLLCAAWSRGEIDGSDKYALYRDVLRFIATSRDKCIVGDQTPQTVFYIDELVRAYPNILVINMVRDPRAVILSQRGKWKVARKLKQPWKETVRSFFNYHPITLSILWNRAISAGSASERKHGNAKICTVVFEKLVTDPQASMMSLCKFIGVNFEDEMLDVDLEGSSNVPVTDSGDSEMGIKGIQSGVTDRWKNKLSGGEIALIQLITRKSRRVYGYDAVATPFPITIVPLLFYFPIHLCGSVLLNIGRVGNPISYIKKRFN